MNVGVQRSSEKHCFAVTIQFFVVYKEFSFKRLG